MLETDKFNAINTARPNWNVTSRHDLRERFPEAHIIDAMKAAELITKGEQKAYHGLLTRRNECAHPSDYHPELNETLGDIDSVSSE